MTLNILVLSPIDPETLEKLSAEHKVHFATDADEENVNTLAAECDILILRSGVNITRKFLENSPRLRLIIRAGSGFDNIDLETARELGIQFARVPEPAAQAVAEMSFALMLALSRRLFEADLSMRQGRWAKFDLMGYLLNNKVLGIVGLGNTGTRTAELGLAWGMKVIGCVEHPSAARKIKFAEKGIELLPFNDVLARSDYISLHVPLKNTTRGLIDTEALARMKPGAYLVNIGRGGVVDEAALLVALKDKGRLRGAALDVHQQEAEGKFSPLVDLQNVILTPHIGAMAICAQREIGRRVLDIVHSWANTCQPRNEIAGMKSK